MAKTSLREVLRFVEDITDPNNISEILAACLARRKQLEGAAYQIALGQAWAAISGVQPGDLLYVHAKDIFVGDRFQQGMALYVESINPENQTVEVTPPGGAKRTFTPREVFRFQLSPEPFV